MTGKLLAIDYSTASTGFALFDVATRKVLDLGAIRPRKPKKLGIQLSDTLEKLVNVADQIVAMIEKSQPTVIVIEQVNHGKNRVSQKTLDGGHWILYLRMGQWLKLVKMVDSDGNTGWRTKLGLALTESDKKLNAERRRLNAKLKRKDQLPILNKKHLAARYVNAALGTSFDVDKNKSDADIVDALGLGLAIMNQMS